VIKKIPNNSWFEIEAKVGLRRSRKHPPPPGRGRRTHGCPASGSRRAAIGDIHVAAQRPPPASTGHVPVPDKTFNCLKVPGGRQQDEMPAAQNAAANGSL
jgi:hypothetical protein